MREHRDGGQGLGQETRTSRRYIWTRTSEMTNGRLKNIEVNGRQDQTILLRGGASLTEQTMYLIRSWRTCSDLDTRTHPKARRMRCSCHTEIRRESSISMTATRMRTCLRRTMILVKEKPSIATRVHIQLNHSYDQR